MKIRFSISLRVFPPERLLKQRLFFRRNQLSCNVTHPVFLIVYSFTSVVVETREIYHPFCGQDAIIMTILTNPTNKLSKWRKPIQTRVGGHA